MKEEDREEIEGLINDRCLQISAHYNSVAEQLSARIKASILNIDYNKYTSLLSQCEKLISSAQKFENFQADIQEIKHFRKILEKIREIIYTEMD